MNLLKMQYPIKRWVNYPSFLFTFVKFLSYLIMKGVKMDKELSINTIKYLDKFCIILQQMIEGMEHALITPSISVTFIHQMIPHHLAAIKMSRNLLLYTTNIPLQNIALQIIKEQTQSIENMIDIQYPCITCNNNERELQEYLNHTDKITKTMFNRMSQACINNNIDISFMNEMIPHHLGAIEMSKNTLQFPICQELKPILDAIIASQEKGVLQMQNLLKQLS